MHGAPSVRYPVGRTRELAWLLAGLGLAGAASALVYLIQIPAAGWRVALPVVAVLLAAYGGWSFWRRLPEGALRWSGSHWFWRPAGALDDAEVAVHVRLDLQSALLLKLEADGCPPLWLWAGRRLAPTMWDDLRRAVYSPAGSAVEGAPTGTPIPP